MSAATTGADRHGWLKALFGTTPDSDRDVLVWHGAEGIPMPAFYDEDENCWFSKVDGCRFDDGTVTHWQEINAPEGLQA